MSFRGFVRRWMDARCSWDGGISYRKVSLSAVANCFRVIIPPNKFPSTPPYSAEATGNIALSHCASGLRPFSSPPFPLSSSSFHSAPQRPVSEDRPSHSHSLLLRTQAPETLRCGQSSFRARTSPFTSFHFFLEHFTGIPFRIDTSPRAPSLCTSRHFLTSAGQSQTSRNKSGNIFIDSNENCRKPEVHFIVIFEHEKGGRNGPSVGGDRGRRAVHGLPVRRDRQQVVGGRTPQEAGSLRP